MPKRNGGEYREVVGFSATVGWQIFGSSPEARRTSLANIKLQFNCPADPRPPLPAAWTIDSTFGAVLPSKPLRERTRPGKLARIRGLIYSTVS